MPRDLFEDLVNAAPLAVPPMPAAFNRRVHQRLNSRLLAGQLFDLAFKGLAYSFVHLGLALAGLFVFTCTGRFDRPDTPQGDPLS
ncbi:MAG: hypothetical protein SGJ20_13140 [Planctomycetota bacterium]|nr:hypothetical protein [Planctomycetota bacterium]